MYQTCIHNIIKDIKADRRKNNFLQIKYIKYIHFHVIPQNQDNKSYIPVVLILIEQ